jgi:hypothetical protein
MDYERRIYVLRLRALRPTSGGIRELRWILKRLLRDHGFRCISIKQVEEQTGVQDGQ